jgi:DNA-binding NarL/FixJ family response regulator
MGSTDDAIYRIVTSRPIPDALWRNLRRAELVSYPRRPQRNMTPCLWETLKLVAQGYSNRAIGRELGIPYETAKDRVKRLLAYFDAPNRMALVVKCYRERIF